MSTIDQRRLLLSMTPNKKGARHAVIVGRSIALCGWGPSASAAPYMSRMPVDCPKCAHRIRSEDVVVTRAPKGDGVIQPMGVT